MTKEEILAMEPGAELDTLVAEKVMGHPMPDFIPEDALDLYLAGTPIHCDSWTCVCRYDEGDTPKWIPAPYSTDISAAWQVVVKLHEEGYVPTVTWLADQCSCTFSKEPASWEGITRISAPEAICKAALIAKAQMIK